MSHPLLHGIPIVLPLLVIVGCHRSAPLPTGTVDVQALWPWQTAAIAPRTVAEVDHLEVRLVPDVGWPSAPYAVAAGTSFRLVPQSGMGRMQFHQVPPGIYRAAVRAFADRAETQNISRLEPSFGGQVAVSGATVLVSVGTPPRYSDGTRLTVVVRLLDGSGDRLDVGLTVTDGNPTPPITAEVL